MSDHTIGSKARAASRRLILSDLRAVRATALWRIGDRDAGPCGTSATTARLKTSARGRRVSGEAVGVKKKVDEQTPLGLLWRSQN